MADKNFGQFTNQTSPATGDFVVGYRGTNEQRYTLHAVSGLIVGEGGDGQGVTAAKNLGASPSAGVLSGVAGTTGIWLKSVTGVGEVKVTTTDSLIYISGTSHTAQGVTGAKNLGAAPSIGVISGVNDTTGIWAKSLSGKGNVALTQNDSTIFISGTAGTTSPLTTKGDLYGFNTDNARVPIGSNGQVLTADSTESLGLKWADSAAGCAISDWVEAFEEDSNGDLMPVSSNCVNDTMWRLNSDNSLSLRSNHFRYNWGAAAFTEDVSF